MIKSFQLPAGRGFMAKTGVLFEPMAEAEKSDDLCLFVCTAGAAVAEVDLRTYDIRPRTEVVMLFGTLLRFMSVSPDFRCSILAYTHKFISEMGIRPDLDLAKHLKLNPVVDMSEEDYEGVVTHVYSLAATLSGRDQDPHQGQKMASLLRIYLDDIHDNCRDKWKDQPQLPTDRQADIFRRFLDLVRQESAESREVEHFADRLSITPRYLSQICQQRNTSPKRIIDESVTFAAKELLHSTGTSIQDIAAELNFADQSVFTRFFRRMTGQSPREWRKNMTE